jgi:hypothetical protein
MADARTLPTLKLGAWNGPTITWQERTRMQDPIAATIDHAVGVARFDAGKLRAAVRDPRATAQAALVVIVVSIAVAIPSVGNPWLLIALAVAGGIALVQGKLRPGSLGAATRHHLRPLQAHVPVPGWVLALGAALLLGFLALQVLPILVPAIAWLAFSVIAWFACNEVVGHPATRVALAPILRAVGFSFAPGVLYVLVNLPVLGVLAAAMAMVWTLSLLTFSIRQTARIETSRALAATALAGLGACLVTLPLLSLYAF